ncbi:MAG TPA: PTS sugar transporter subunit IIA [Erysipelothrix sp.]|jgi:mannitol/fructose-specific phosphotransferase system IIA component|nr:PTS sugar transporter subunit IIA [Erysipelothrix sp.]
MKPVLSVENVKLNQSFTTKEEAIVAAGNVLVENGYVKPEYVDKMLEREKIATTFMGNNIAIPHSTEGGTAEIIESGISILIVPEGVKFGEDTVKVVFGIAGKDGSHMEILSQIAIYCSEQENVDKLVEITDPQEAVNLIGGDL